MPTTSWKYLPILKWKLGEQDAFRHLTLAQQDGLVPLIELQPDHGSTLAALATAVAEEIGHCVAAPTVAVETIYIIGGASKPVEQLASFCNLLQGHLGKHQVIPVIHGALLESLSSASARAREILKDFPEIFVRLRSSLIQPEQVAPSVLLARAIGIRTSAIHLLIDQYSMVGADPIACDTAVRPYLAAAVQQKCASVTVAGGSFPINLMGFKAGTHDIPRVEWQTWNLLRKSGQFPAVRYSDYAVTNPSPLERIDPKQVNPSISIRYAGPDFWRIYKGGGFKKGKPGTLKGLCKLLVMDSVYKGASFSAGDASYDKAANSAKLTNGVPWTWRRDATNHHMALTASAL